ncbi:MAG: 23S rRNA (pseudouridine(1915)-N(3))-methyltransferase RlmH [Deltaproteobacteria bacterium]|nr:23S rRNA (pseudouridine(1915)-N(3))-methyltransferase RlmH [Deltaproteobacteria bacterium]
MLNVNVLMVGKTREGFIREGLEFYRKRLKPLMQLNLTSVREEKETAGLTPDTIKAKEGERLQTQAPPKSYLVALDPKGRECTTEEFADWLTRRELAARPLAFLIGGHWGLAAAVLAAVNERFSLSRLTLTHELARLILLEQLYRAMTIKMGHPYHV